MTKIVWDKIGERIYETGVEQAVLYPQTAGKYPNGVAWNGLISVSEKPSGAESTPLYANNGKYVNLLSNELFGATIEAYTYPDEYAECDGSVELVKGVKIGQQSRKPFGLSYKTQKGNDVDGTNFGYLLHLVYGASAAPSEKAYSTVNDTPEAITFSWEISTTPVSVTGHKSTATLVIDSTTVDPEELAKFEEILYGKDATDEPDSSAVEARLPFPDEVATFFKKVTI